MRAHAGRGVRLLVTGGLLAACSLAGVAGAPTAGAGAPTTTVNTLIDVVSSSDAFFSLREAFTQASNTAGDAQIQIGVAGEFQLTLCGGAGQEDANANGDLDHNDDDLVILAPSQPITIRQTCTDERVIDLHAGGQLVAQNVTITEGKPPSGQNGGGIRATGQVALTDSRVVDNQTFGTGDGGGIFASGFVDLDGTEVSDNTSTDGGGVFAFSGIEATDSSISANIATQNGGGVFMDSDGTFTSTTVAGNQAIFGNGGGVFTSDDNVTLTYATVAGNQALDLGNTGTGIAAFFLTSNRSIVAANFASDISIFVPQCDVDGSSSGGFNLEGGTSCDFTGGTDHQNAGNAGLRAVFRNGGPTTTVWPGQPEAGDESPIDLIPNGQCADADDQRGSARPIGAGCDIGAVEVQACGDFFLDVAASHPFCDEIGWMNEAGITTGFPGGLYKPSDAVTRQSMSAFMFRLAGSPPFVDPVTPTFVDVPTSSPFFTEIEWMADEGITTGFPGGLFKPADKVTRQSMSAFMFRLADGLVE